MAKDLFFCLFLGGLGGRGGVYFSFSFVSFLLKHVDNEEWNGRRSKDERGTTPFYFFF
jgi:hypothetical protein